MLVHTKFTTHSARWGVVLQHIGNEFKHLVSAID